MKKAIAALFAALILMTAYAQAASLKQGDRRNAVLELQNRLYELGYYDGEMTGYYGSMTTTAVRNFQTANGLKVTGDADEKTLAAIASENAVPKSAYLISSETEEEILHLDEDLEPGDSGAAVKQLQKLLTELGYFNGDCTGLFGSVTQTALMEFQTMNFLEVTGIADEMTREMLNAGEGLGVAEASEMMAVWPLSVGDTGTEVTKVQQQLFEAGYLTIEPGGIFDKNTEKAVKRFQIANGIEASGVADEDTRTLLNDGESITLAEYIDEQNRIEVRKGDSGYTVRLLEEELQRLGYFNGTVDSTFDEETEKAVLLFQKGNNLEQTGVADAETRSRMNDETGLSYEEALALYKQAQQLSAIEEKTDIVMKTAYGQVGQAYAYGAVGANAYDSAGLTEYVYAQAGITLKASAYEQASDGSAVETPADLVSGDLVVLCDHASSESSYHIGIYIGDEKIIHVSESTGIVVISSLTDPKYEERFACGRRVIQ